MDMLTLKEAIEQRLFVEGNCFLYHPEAREVEIDSELTNWRLQVFKGSAAKAILCRCITSVDSGENVKLLGEPTEEKLTLGEDCRKPREAINKLCDEMFSIQDEIRARSINGIENDSLSRDLKAERSYYVDEYISDDSSNRWRSGIIAVLGGYNYDCYVSGPDSRRDCSYVRPVIELFGENIMICVDENHIGTEKKPYDIIIKNGKTRLLTVKEFLSQYAKISSYWFIYHLVPKKFEIRHVSWPQCFENIYGETHLLSGRGRKDNTLILLGEPTKEKLFLSGYHDCDFGPGAIHELCMEKFSVSKQVSARSITFDENERQYYDRHDREYWLPKDGEYHEKWGHYHFRGVYCNFSTSTGLRNIVTEYINMNFERAGVGESFPVRPVVSFYGDKVRIGVSEVQNGTEEKPFEIFVLE